MKIGPVTTTGFDDLAPGEIVVERTRVLVGTAAAPVALGSVQPAGKPMMPAVDWSRGAQPTPGERFGSDERIDATGRR